MARVNNDLENGISIHAPRIGCVCIPHNLNRDVNYFNSHSPQWGNNEAFASLA